MRKIRGFLVAIVVTALLAAGAVAQYATSNYQATGGARWVVGGVIDIVSGGQLQIAGVDRTAALTTAPASVAAGYKIARGQQTTASAADTVVTGLATVVSVICTYDTDVADANSYVSCTIGDQAGAPAAGSVIIKTWQNTGGTDPTPAAAGSFSKKVNWIAIGT